MYRISQTRDIQLSGTTRTTKGSIVRVDAHQHFWQWSKGWFSRLEPVLSRDYLPEDLDPILREQGMDKTIVVQTSPTVVETDFLLEFAETSSFIGGVVGWLDLEAPDFLDTLERYRQNRYFVAIRPMLQQLPEDDWILRPRVLESLSLIAQTGLAFDFLTVTRHLPYVLRVLERLPHLRAVMDHLSKPEIKARAMQPWKELMREVSLHRNVNCKLSGMMTEADPQNWNLEQLRPYADHVMEHFEVERVMFGSDWPVSLLAASYGEVLGTTRALVTSSFGQGAEDAVFGDNAARFYHLEEADAMALA
jgi:L-fuconolactonase